MALTIIVPYNDLGAVARAFEEHPGEIAGMILEPIMMNAGIIRPSEGYLQGLKDLLHATRRAAQLRRGEDRPDLRLRRCDGSHGGDAGHHVPRQGDRGRDRLRRGRRERRGDGARRERRLRQVGTFNGNPLAMAATRAMLTEVATPEAYERVGQAGGRDQHRVRPGHRGPGPARPCRLGRGEGVRHVPARAGP